MEEPNDAPVPLAHGESVEGMPGVRPASGIGRRQFLEIAGGAAAASVAAQVVPWDLIRTSAEAAIQAPPSITSTRRETAYQIRHQAALHHYQLPGVEHPTNGDEQRYPNRIASYSKALPHNELGEVEPAAYDALLVAARSGDLADFAAIPRGGGLIPIAFPDAFAYVLEGSDPHQFTMSPAPAFASEEMAADMVELYWRALARDVPFSQYGEEALTCAAIEDLRQFSRFEDLTVETLFRGPALGETTGPYLSQFLWKDVPFGAQRIVQTCRLPVPNRDYLTDYDLWLRRQNGGPPGPPVTFDPNPRYLCCGRDLAE